MVAEERLAVEWEGTGRLREEVALLGTSSLPEREVGGQEQGGPW